MIAQTCAFLSKLKTPLCVNRSRNRRRVDRLYHASQTRATLGTSTAKDFTFMRTALRLAQRGYGATSPNPMVGAVLVKRGEIIGRGWHRRAGLPHAEIEALSDAERRGHSARGATLYITLEPCCTHGRTPPCTDAMISAGLRRVITAATDPNPEHAGRGFEVLRHAGIDVIHGVLAEKAARLNEAFNHWIVHRTPFVTVKAAMSLDGKIATRTGESKWITGDAARTFGMKLRQGSDAILVGVNTVLADDPSLTVRAVAGTTTSRQPQRIVLDSEARTPLTAKLVTDSFASRTTIVVSNRAPAKRVNALRERVRVEEAPLKNDHLNLVWLAAKLGAQDVTSLLVEGGGEVNASFLFGDLAHRIAFFYAPKIIGGWTARKGVAGEGVTDLKQALKLNEVKYRWLGEDLLMTGRLQNRAQNHES
jgi:diaminohydroxyphosphoribosylaminopyrimidine deaminase / 5-amino-6-(5-phosphoribosylamino)uracil reductase